MFGGSLCKICLANRLAKGGHTIYRGVRFFRRLVTFELLLMSRIRLCSAMDLWCLVLTLSVLMLTMGLWVVMLIARVRGRCRSFAGMVTCLRLLSLTGRCA